MQRAVRLPALPLLSQRLLLACSRGRGSLSSSSGLGGSLQLLQLRLQLQVAQLQAAPLASAALRSARPRAALLLLPRALRQLLALEWELALPWQMRQMGRWSHEEEERERERPNTHTFEKSYIKTRQHTLEARPPPLPNLSSSHCSLELMLL